jgi:hypothetical protein
MVLVLGSGLPRIKVSEHLQSVIKLSLPAVCFKISNSFNLAIGISIIFSHSGFR